MPRAILPLSLAAALAATVVTGAQAGPWYVRGDHYCPAPGPDSCWVADAGNEMFDDGQHGLWL